MKRPPKGRFLLPPAIDIYKFMLKYNIRIKEAISARFS